MDESYGNSFHFDNVRNAFHDDEEHELSPQKSLSSSNPIFKQSSSFERSPNQYYMSEPSNSEDDHSRQLLSDDTKSPIQSPKDQHYYRKNFLHQFQYQSLLQSPSNNEAGKNGDFNKSNHFDTLTNDHNFILANPNEKSFSFESTVPNEILPNSKRIQTIFTPDISIQNNQNDSPELFFTPPQIVSPHSCEVNHPHYPQQQQQQQQRKTPPNSSPSFSEDSHKSVHKKTHRRKRSGDAAAATLMTGGVDWIGMTKDGLPIPSPSPSPPRVKDGIVSFQTNEMDEEDTGDEGGTLGMKQKGLRSVSTFKKRSKHKIRGINNRSERISNIGIIREEAAFYGQPSQNIGDIDDSYEEFQPWRNEEEEKRQKSSLSSIDYSDTGESLQTQTTVFSWISGRFSSFSEMLPSTNSIIYDKRSNMLQHDQSDFQNIDEYGDAYCQDFKFDASRSRSDTDDDSLDNNSKRGIKSRSAQKIQSLYDATALRKSEKPGIYHSSQQNNEKSSHEFDTSGKGIDNPSFLRSYLSCNQHISYIMGSVLGQNHGNLGYFVIFFVTSILVGMFTFNLNEGWSVLDCIYFSVSTFTTAGLGDLVPSTPKTKITTAILSYMGVVSIGLLLGLFLAENQARQCSKQPNCSGVPRHRNRAVGKTWTGLNPKCLKSMQKKDDSFIDKIQKGENYGSLRNENNDINCQGRIDYNSDVADEEKPMLPEKGNGKHYGKNKQYGYQRLDMGARSKLSISKLEGQRLLDGNNPPLSKYEEQYGNVTKKEIMGTSIDDQDMNSSILHNRNVGATHQKDSDTILYHDSQLACQGESGFDERTKMSRFVCCKIIEALIESMIITTIGALGFRYFERYNSVDSFYFAIVLFTSVGYGDITPKTKAGKIFAIFYILAAGTVLLKNMALIGIIPIELRNKKAENDILRQFTEELDDETLKEVTNGPIMRQLRSFKEAEIGSKECDREMFALSMLVHCGRISEEEMNIALAAFRVLEYES